MPEEKQFLVVVDSSTPIVVDLINRLLNTAGIEHYVIDELSHICSLAKIKEPIILLGGLYYQALQELFPDTLITIVPHQNRLSNKKENKIYRQQAIDTLRALAIGPIQKEQLSIQIETETILVSDTKTSDKNKPCLSSYEVLILDAFKRVFPNSQIKITKE